MPATSYDLAVDSWTDTETINIIAPGNVHIAIFPLSFVSRGGDNTWRYVLETVNHLIDRIPDRPGVIVDAEDVPVELAEAPGKGVYCFKQFTIYPRSPAAPRFSRGPEYFTRFRPLNPEGSFSTRSDSKRSSVNQTRFRVAVVARDSTCLVTDVMYTYCTACHIVPFSRPDVYQDVLEINHDPPMFKASVGLLLRDDLHHAYDRLEWSLYHKDGTYYVHFFILNFPNAASLHGNAIGPERFRGPASERPNPRLIEWHYSQCVKAHIRGFSAGMGAEGQD